MQIIPAIDIIEGKCVRLTAGDYAQKKVYNENPLEVALQFEAAGFKRLHLVDLDGAKAGSVKNRHVLDRIASNTNLQIDFGGGIKTADELQSCFNAGASYATIGSLAVKNKDLFESWIDQYGVTKFFLGADVKADYIAINGWMETTSMHINEFLSHYTTIGIRYVFCTDVSKDGRLQGPSIALYQGLLKKFPGLHLVGSGGVSNMTDVIALKQAGCSGVIIGKAIYENRITLKELSEWNT